MPINIIVHAAKMLLNNLNYAFKIGLVPFLLSQVVALGFYYFATGSFFATPDMLAASIEEIGLGAYYLGLIVLVVLNLFVLGWLAVNWHRFVLLQEYPAGFLPPVHGPQTKSYVGKLLLIMLIVIGLAIPISIVVGLMAVVLQGLGYIGILIPVIIIYAVLGWVIMRLSLVLPSVSIGKDMALKEAWNATKPLAGSIFWVAVISGLLSASPGIIALILPTSAIVNFTFSLIMGFIGIMMAASILTTIYGVVVEDRELT